MSTAEILIVFSALMALVALVTIGIDWIGQPLKHRRFIPRMYRFEDEKLPVDEFGNTRFDALETAGTAGSAGTSGPHYPPPYGGPWLHHESGNAQPIANQTPNTTYAQPAHDNADPASQDRANPTVVVPSQPAPRAVAKLDPEVAASRSAFTDSLVSPDSEVPPDSAGAQAGPFARSTIAGTHATPPAASTGHSWIPAMALDATINDKKPSLSDKAERFWIATAVASADSHFDSNELQRMAQGKAPRRTNPRTGKTEAMQLTGLRQASVRDDVRMRWPDDAVDPWSAS